MKQITSEKTYSFKSFQEMFDFIRNESDGVVAYKNHAITMTDDCSFYYDESDDEEIASIVDFDLFIDENGVVDEESIREEYNLEDFVGKKFVCEAIH